MSSHNESATPITINLKATSTVEINPAAPVAAHKSLAKAVFDRRNEYTRPQKTRIKIGSWNVAACAGVENDLKGWFVEGKGLTDKLSDLNLSGEHSEEDKKLVEDSANIESVQSQEKRYNKKKSTLPIDEDSILPANDEIGLYVLGLQEVLDISSATEVLRPYADPTVPLKWKSACALALPSGYKLVAEQQLSGMLLLIYASPKVYPSVTSVSTTTVGTGIMGYMGNKGGTIARLLLGDTTRLVFINSHLAAGNEKGSLDRRNWDASQIILRTKFDPIDHGNGVVEEIGEGLGDEDFAFWFGDLNYRLGTMPGDDVRRLLEFHTRNEYDNKNASLAMIDNELNATSTSAVETGSASEAALSNDGASADTTVEEGIDPENDPASLMTTITSLMPHDQLSNQIRSKKAFHEGWKEGPIKFLPTYKYDVGSVGVFDSSEKKRAPSWCDRILFRTRKDYQAYLAKAKEEELAAKRDAEMKARGLDQDDGVIFDYDPDTDGAYDENDDVGQSASLTETVLTKEGYEDKVKLEYYTSHQRVLSSDHKPLDAIFELTYDAVDRELKKNVQAEVAREMDKDENESRPTVTLVVDHAEVKDGSAEGINYGDIRFDIPKTHNITVANTGRVPATVGFVNDLASQTQHQWLHASFDGVQSPTNSNHLAIEPGETMVIRLTIHVTDPTDIRALNTGAAPLEDVRVLRVENGRDHFITLKGNWMKSAFGLSLEELIRVPEGGVRSCCFDESFANESVKWSAPRELFRLTDAFEHALERAVAEWGMKEPKRDPPWATDGWPFVQSARTIQPPDLKPLVAKIREALDTNEAIPNPPQLPSPLQVEALGVTLLQFLACLDSGIINAELWDRVSEALAERDRAKRPSDPDSTRLLAIDVFSSASTRSVAFNLIVLMLERTLSEIAPVSGLKKSENMPSVMTPAGILGRVRGPSNDPKMTKRRNVEKKFVEVFEPLLFHIKGDEDKEKKAGNEKRKELLTCFIQWKPHET